MTAFGGVSRPRQRAMAMVVPRIHSGGGSFSGVALVVAALALTGCAAAPTGPTAFVADNPDLDSSPIEPCEVDAEMRARRPDGGDRVEWNARVSCNGGSLGGPGIVRIRFGVELIVNGTSRDRFEWHHWVGPFLLESGQTGFWLCGGYAYEPEPPGYCGWPLPEGRLNPEDTYEVKGHWTRCLASRSNCPGDPFGEDEE